MKTQTRKLLSVMLSFLMTLMCMTTASVYADYQAIPEQNSKSLNKMTFFMDNMQVSAGQDLQLDIKAINPVAINSLENIILTIPDGFEVTGMSDSSPMFNGSVEYIVSGNSLNFTISSGGSLNENGTVATINLHVSENCTPQTYDFKWVTTAMSCTASTGSRYSPTFLMGRITVGGSASTTQTTTPATTQTTTTTTTTTPTTTTTTVSTYLNVIIDSYPTKTAYTVGEELDLSGGKFHSEGVDSYGRRFRSIHYFMSDDENVDTSEFDNTKAGTYRIYIRVNYENMYAENYFEVTVNEPDTTTTTTTTQTTITTVNAYINITIDSLPTKTAYIIGEELDLSGGKWHSEGVKADGTPFNSVPYDMIYNSRVDTSAFDNTKAGTYRIYLREDINGLYGENFFDVTVSAPEITLGDLNGDGLIDTVDAAAVLIEYAKLSTGNIGSFDENHKKSADLNKDGYTDSVDASLILMYYAYVSTSGTDTLENWLFTHNI